MKLNIEHFGSKVLTQTVDYFICFVKKIKKYLLRKL